MDKSTVRRYHKQCFQDGDTNEDNTEAIINVIGGIDRIISHYLSDWNNKLDSKQIHKIYRIISTPTKYQQKNKIPLDTKIQNIDPSKNSQYEDKRSFEYTFEQDDNLLNTIFDPQNAKLITWIFSNNMFRFLLIISAMIHIIGLILHDTFWHPIFVIFINIFLWIPNGLFWILCVNKKAFKLILYRFEFWFKIVFAIMAQIAALIDDFMFIQNYQQWTYPKLKLATNIMLSCDIVFILTCVSLLDALYLKKYWKIMVSSLVAAVFVFWALMLQFRPYSNDHNINISNIEFSVKSIRISAFRTVAIFVLKQAVLHIFRTRYNRAVMIRCTPYLAWKSSEENEPDDDVLKLDINHGVNTDSTSPWESMDLNVMNYILNTIKTDDEAEKNKNTTNHATNDIKIILTDGTDLEHKETETTIIYTPDDQTIQTDDIQRIPTIESKVTFRDKIVTETSDNASKDNTDNTTKQMKYGYDDKELSVITRNITDTLVFPAFQMTSTPQHLTPNGGHNNTPVTKFSTLQDADTYQRESVSASSIIKPVPTLSVNGDIASITKYNGKSNTSTYTKSFGSNTKSMSTCPKKMELNNVSTDVTSRIKDFRIPSQEELDVAIMIDGHLGISNSKNKMGLKRGIENQSSDLTRFGDFRIPSQEAVDVASLDDRFMTNSAMNYKFLKKEVDLYGDPEIVMEDKFEFVNNDDNEMVINDNVCHLDSMEAAFQNEEK